MKTDPPTGCGRNSAIMLMIALIFLIAAALSWAWLKDPPSAPNPSATGTPASVPQGGGGS